MSHSKASQAPTQHRNKMKDGHRARVAYFVVCVATFTLTFGEVSASLWGDDVRNQQCRTSINDALHLFGPATASGNPTIGIPQECALLFPGRNIYAGEKGEVVLGSFIAPDCGACAGACVASYKNANTGGPIGAYYFQDDVTKDMSPSALTDFRDIMLKSMETCQPCTDWVYCSPAVAVTTTSTSLEEVPGSNGTYSYVPNDPALAGSSCIGRYVNGEMKPYGEGYRGYGPDLCLVKSMTGCDNPTPNIKVAPGTCTLKFIDKSKVSEHFPPKLKDELQTASYYGNENYDMWDYIPDQDAWSKTNSMWEGDSCPDEDVPYPVVTSEDLANCPGIDPMSGVFMSGMCNWTPGIGLEPIAPSCVKDEGAVLTESKQDLDNWLDSTINNLK